MLMNYIWMHQRTYYYRNLNSAQRNVHWLLSVYCDQGSSYKYSKYSLIFLIPSIVSAFPQLKFSEDKLATKYCTKEGRWSVMS